ncbi:MAG: hypothetical protein IKQ92_11175 [Clostridia bacterium]|nr:hypothetical protein [Clostridia bacterium]
MKPKTFFMNVLWSFIPIYVGQFVGFILSFVGYSLFPMFIRSEPGRYAACAISTVIACILAAFILCRIRGEAQTKAPDYRPLHDFLAFAAAEGIYILVMILTGGRTFSTVNVLYACMAILGESAATNEAIRNNYPGLVALMIVCMNVVTLPFAFLGFVSGKKKRENDRASLHGVR